MEPDAPIIPLYREINDCHLAAGFPLRTNTPEFHVFDIKDTYPCDKEVMAPFRRGFYQVTLLETMENAKISFEDTAISGAVDVLVFSPPEQVMSWHCGGSEQGFMLYFKPELLAQHGKSLEQMFPYFEAHAASVLPVKSSDRIILRSHFDALNSAAKSKHAYRIPQLAALTTAFLYECLGLYDQAGGSRPESLGSSALVGRFRQMVARCFSQHCSVENYAECLHVSADHLRAMVKKYTGRTAREFIDERVMLEAKRLLLHTSLSVGEVAWHLQFQEQTHFARFFKRHTGKTPVEFKKESTHSVLSVA